ncbi:receptor-like protein 6 [Hevea brasiliensis]|nr:receptor-like protein 6 [Hevea brasiliensis]
MNLWKLAIYIDYDTLFFQSLSLISSIRKMNFSVSKHQVTFFLLFHLHCLLIISSSSTTACLEDDSISLLQLKNDFSCVESASIDYKPPHPRMVSWDVGSDCCSWDGVTCDGVTGEVIGLDLSCSGLRGSLTSNSNLFNLSHLQRLNIAFNHFNLSNIPPEFGRFANLTHLNLSATWFSGPVPSEISYLSKLVSLDLSINEPLRLETPTMQMIVQNLTQVREVFLDYINMSFVTLNTLVNLSSSVTTLSLVYCGLRGEFPETIFYLPKLQFLNLMLNDDLYGYLPKSDWSGPLELLVLSFTSFSGELPDSIGNLKSLMVLELGSCHFSGSIPASLGSLKQLTRLDLSYTNWTGMIPDVFENLSNLEYVSASSSNFSGMLPSSIFNLSKLYWLDLSQNQLKGSLPNQICGLSNLIRLDLSYNLFSGTIPSCLYGLPSLLWFSLSFNITACNNIYGSIPPSVFELENLQNLHLPSNNLSGIVDLNMFSKLKNLRGLDLSNNHLSVITSKTSNTTWPQFYRLGLASCNIRELPGFLKTQNQLGFLSLPHNRIHGEVPKWLMGVGMQYLDLSYNFLTKVSELSSNLQYLDLSFNVLHQPLPLPPPSMYMLLISSNKLTREISPLICNVTNFQIIDLSNNSLSGMIPQCLGNFSSELSVLNLGMNRLRGSIPGIFTQGNKLRNLNLNGNQLEGPLPRSLSTCKMLEVLDLGNNQINDSFPPWLETLPKLHVLVLRSNRFHGFIGEPEGISPFSSLRIIDLSHNDFTGNLPTKYFAHFQAMMKVDEVKEDVKYMGELYYHDSVVLTMKGNEFSLVRILNIFTTIDLSSNRFEGQIPELIGNLGSLLMLNFSHNSLTGQIPSSLGNLINLESLDLSSNKLDGGIPDQLTSLTFLEAMNLSYNQLAGPIPHGKQFSTFDNDSFIGNLGLCGLPLSEKCSSELAPQPPPPSSISYDNKDSASIFDWKFAMMGFGCGLVFGLSMGYIVFATGKPQWLVGMAEKGQRKRLTRRNQRLVRRRN